MALNKTILYYTSNQENQKFEKWMMGIISENSGGLPIVSVSQKPIDFGKNICVGDVGCSSFNMWRQILIGLKEIKTEYVIFTEADCLYPPEYFDFDPPDGNFYRYNNVWIVFYRGRAVAYKKHWSNAAQIGKRDYLLQALEEYFEGQPQWADKWYATNKDGTRREDYNGVPFEYFKGEVPCISFKTGKGLTTKTVFKSGVKNCLEDLPYWGNVEEMRKKYIYE